MLNDLCSCCSSCIHLQSPGDGNLFLGLLLLVLDSNVDSSSLDRQILPPPFILTESPFIPFHSSLDDVAKLFKCVMQVQSLVFRLKRDEEDGDAWCLSLKFIPWDWDLAFYFTHKKTFLYWRLTLSSWSPILCDCFPYIPSQFKFFHSFLLLNLWWKSLMLDITNWLLINDQRLSLFLITYFRRLLPFFLFLSLGI